jgi:AcrR family transcriptional regulator
MNMFTGKGKRQSPASGRPPQKRRGPGRPRGQSEQGVAARQRLYQTAIKLIASRGYHATTLRAIARKADVSVGLLYRYFPSKRAVVLALYEDLSADYAARASQMRPAPWRERFLFALRVSLEAPGRHRRTLAALLPVLIGDDKEGLFAPATGLSRDRVQSIFQQAVSGAADAPQPAEDAAALGRLLYVVHLAVILWWLIDKSRDQRASAQLVDALERALPAANLVLGLAAARPWLGVADTLCREGLFGDQAPTKEAPCR